MQVSDLTEETKTNGFESSKPTNLPPLLMEKPNPLMEDKPIIPLTRRLEIYTGLRKILKNPWKAWIVRFSKNLHIPYSFSRQLERNEYVAQELLTGSKYS